MNDLQSRIKDYLDRKKPAEPKVMTEHVTTTDVPEPELWLEFKSDMRKLLRPYVVFTILISIGFLAFAMKIVEIEMECYKNEECREWIENR